MRTIRAEEATVDILLSSFHGANRAVTEDGTIVMNGATIAGWLIWMEGDLPGAIAKSDDLPANAPWCYAAMYLRGAEQNERAVPRASGDRR